MPRLTQDQWAAARIKWEADPLLTFEALGAELGVSAEAPRKRAKTEGWERVPDLRLVSKAAQIKADAREAAKVGKVGGEVGNPTTKRATRELAEDIRTDVVERHRADWAEHRVHFKTGDIAADFDTGKSAKISAEMLKIRQAGERAAYGLDETTATEATEIVRSYGVRA